MAGEWFYAKDGQQQGPVSGQALKEMAQSGELKPEDHVWSESLKDWTPAGRLPALAKVMAGGQSGAAPGVATATPIDPEPVRPQQIGMPMTVDRPHGVLGYEAPTSDGIVFTNQCLQELRGTKPWAIFVAVITFIACGFMALGAIGMFIAAMAARSEQMINLGIGLLYVVFAVIFALPAVQLCKFASGIGQLQHLKRTDKLEALLQANRKYWRGLGMAIIMYIAAIIALIVVVILFAAM